jgi:hypothetical protein
VSYPFTKAKSWRELIAEMRPIGVSFETVQVTGPKGEKIIVQHFKHQMDGKQLRCVVDICYMDEFVMPTMLRVICRKLHIHPSVFGLDLG